MRLLPPMADAASSLPAFVFERPEWSPDTQTPTAVQTQPWGFRFYFFRFYDFMPPGHYFARSAAPMMPASFPSDAAMIAGGSMTEDA